MKIDVENQNHDDEDLKIDQGLSKIELNGRELFLTGWFDHYEIWYAAVTLTPEQAKEMARALAGIADA